MQNYLRKDVTGYVGWRKIGTYIHTYIHTYSISLSFFKNIIEILKVHFTSLKRVNKVCLFVFLFEKQSFA